MLKTPALSAALALMGTVMLAGQAREVPGDMVTVTSKVAAIERSNRTVTLQKENGTYTTVVVPASYTRFDGIKVGDTVTARYYDNVVFRKLNPGEQPTNSSSGGIVPTAGTRPGGTAAVQREMTTKITAIDEKVPSITFTGPNNWVYSSKVKDPSVLKTVAVGDMINITWTEALSIEVTPPK